MYTPFLSTGRSNVRGVDAKLLRDFHLRLRVTQISDIGRFKIP